MGYPDLGETCERCWGCIFFWIYVNWLVLVAWDLWNLQHHPTKPSQPMLLRIAPFFFGLTAAHSKNNNQVSILSVFQRFQHIFSWNIFSHHLESHRFVSWKVNKDIWGAPLLEPFGLFKHEKKESFMTFKEVIAVKRRLLSHLCTGWSIRIPAKSCCQVQNAQTCWSIKFPTALHKPTRRFLEWKSYTSPWSLCRQSWVHSMSLIITSWVCRQGWK